MTGLTMKSGYLNDPHANKAADDIVALLKLCQQLQSEKDGRERAVPGTYSRDEDEFADRIRTACGHVTQLRQLLLMMCSMSAIGTELESRGEIHVVVGEDYAEKALSWLMEKYVKDEAP